MEKGGFGRQWGTLKWGSVADRRYGASNPRRGDGRCQRMRMGRCLALIVHFGIIISINIGWTFHLM